MRSKGRSRAPIWCRAVRSLLGINDSNRRWWVLAATGGSLGIVLLDETVIGVALPTIRDDLGMSQLASPGS